MPGSDSGKKQQRRGPDEEGTDEEEAGLALAMGAGEDDDEEYELGQEQVIQTILLLGNEIWRNFGQEEEIDDYAVFFQHQFYIECFQMAYPSYDFSDLVKATDDAESPDQMAACIQALINLLSEEILAYDMNHIRGDEIVNGNAEHCINLLQILQQISSASMMQEASGDGSEAARSEAQPMPGRGTASEEAGRAQSSPDKMPGSSSGAGGSNSGNAPKSRATTGEKGKDDQDNQDPRGPLFDPAMGNIEDLDGAEGNPAFLRSSSNKHQFLDNLDAEIGMNDDDDDEQEMDEDGDPHGGVHRRPDNRNTNSKLGADKVGDVIGQELDVEFEAAIQDNLQNHQGRGSAGSAGSSEQPAAAQQPANQKQQIFDGEDNEFDEHDGIVDHNEVNIIDDGQEYLEHDQNDDSAHGSDGDLRDLNGQVDNMANLEDQMRGAGGPNEMADYDDELDGQDEDEEDLAGLQDGSDQYDENQQLILDDQNLDMDDVHDLGPGKAMAERRVEDHDDDEDDDDDEALDLAGMDPALLERAGQQLAMAADRYAVPDSDLMQQRTEGVGEEQVEDGSPISAGDEDQEDAQGLEELLGDVHGDGQHSDEGVGKQILRGGQNIEDDPQLEVDDDDDLPDVEVEMSEKLKLLQRGAEEEEQRALRQLRQQMEDDDDDVVEDDDQGQDAFGDDDEPMIDTDNLDDKEKALLCRYLQAEYEKDPESLPMPREVVEEFLARNRDLLEQLDDLDDDGQVEMQPHGPSEGLDDGGESLNNGIDSNEIVVEGQHDEDGKQSSDEEDDDERGDNVGMGNQHPAHAEDEDDDEDEPDDDMIEDPEGQYLDREQLAQQQRMQVGEMNIEGSEQMILNNEEEEDMAVANAYVPPGASEYIVQQHPGSQEDGDGALQGYGEEDDVVEDEDEQNPHQMFNPQYQLDEIQEVEQDDGNGYMFQAINVQQPANLTEEQLHYLQQQQLPMEQMSLQQPGLARKPTGKRKKLTSAYARKPPALAHGGAFQRGSAAGLVGRAATSAAAKKSSKRMKAGNTISHDDEQQAHGGRQLGGLDVGNYGASRSAQRRPASHKRPQTAKPRKTLGLGGRARQRQGNFFGAPPSGSFKAAVTSSTPSNRLRSGKVLGAGAAGSLKNMIVPQQSQMFTSFGVPQGAMQSVSQRKAASNPKKRYQGLYGSVKGAAPPLKKKTRAANQASVPRLARNAKKAQQYQGQVPVQPQVQQQVSNQPMPTAAADQAQNLVEMPILSEEFLNQLNEEQLQALLEQQQQLMMLQQQNQVQPANGNLGGLQSDEQEQQFQNQMPEEGQLYQPLQLGSVQQSSTQSGMRSRGRAKAYAQAAGPLAARIPSASRKATLPASAGGPRASSGSRSAHGSRKRTQKTRSSLNIASSGPLSLGPPISGLGPAGPASSNSIFRSQKMAAQIYGNSADSMLNNLISQRKKSGKGGKKRSQPNQAGKALAHQLSQMQQDSEPYDIQAQLLAQQAQYNKLLAQQQPGVTADQLAANQLHPGYGQAPDAAQGNRQGVQSEGTEGIIAEVPPEQEEGESQSQFNQLSQQRQQLLMQMQQQQMVGGQSNIQPLQGQISSIADDLSTEQIIELLQNAADAQNSQNNGELDGDGNFDENGAPIGSSQGQQLPEEIQLQLQQVLQERMLQQQQQQFLLQQQQMLNPGLQQAGRPAPVAEAIAGMALNDRVQSYQNICNILTESVAKARRKHVYLTGDPRRGGGLHSSSSSPQRATMPGKRAGAIAAGGRESLEADQRILKQKKQFENLLRQYRMDLKMQETKRQQDLRRAEKVALREEKIQQMKQKKFEEGMISQQRSQIIKRNAQQARLCKKVFKLASDLEKDKLLEEKKQQKERELHKVSQRQAMVHTIENYYKDKIDMLKDRIDQEKFERQVAQEAQKKAFSQMKKELGDQKRKEVERYIQLLQQEDDKFDLSNLDASRLEHEVVRLYKKKQ